MANERPHWPFRPTPNGRRPAETGGQLKLLQRQARNISSLIIQNLAAADSIMGLYLLLLALSDLIIGKH